MTALVDAQSEAGLVGGSAGNSAQAGNEASPHSRLRQFCQ